VILGFREHEIGMIRGAVAIWIVAVTSIWAQNSHPLTGRKLPAAGGEGQAAAAVRADPDVKDQSVMALEIMGIESGTTVAVVCGVADSYTLLLAGRIGDSGTVYAVETQPALLDQIRKMVVSASFSNVKVVRGTDQNPRLPAGKISLVLLPNAYSDFTHPQEMLRKLGESLRPDGRLVIIEYRAEDGPGPASAEPRMSVQQIKTEVEAEGFKFQKVVGLLRQHLLIFTKSAAVADAARSGQAP
jgi:predicted methyltransferase